LHDHSLSQEVFVMAFFGFCGRGEYRRRQFGAVVKAGRQFDAADFAGLDTVRFLVPEIDISC